MGTTLEFKDINGIVATEGNWIVHEKNVGKVRRIFKSGTNDRMEIDFRSHYLELNTNSIFEIVNEKTVNIINMKVEIVNRRL